ncbi:MAG: 50S ribosomal protein L21 [Candidatus Latescibacteria bacterium]|nr:50S ribosomal protein L21 [Candidatus Latescibacterota bacterium]
MYAVIECGGTQVRVFQNAKVRIPRIDAKEGEKYKIEKILLVSNGQDIVVGSPTVKDAVVEATVVGHPRSAKIVGMIYKPKKDYRRHWGARTHYTELFIEKVSHPTVKPLEKLARPGAARKKTVKKALPKKLALRGVEGAAAEKIETKSAKTEPAKPVAVKGGKK